MKIYLIFISIALFCCKKNQLEVLQNNIEEINVNTCLDTCGNIIYAKHYFNNTDTIRSVLTLSTFCDTLEIVSYHTIQEVQYYLGMQVCFTRN